MKKFLIKGQVILHKKIDEDDAEAFIKWSIKLFGEKIEVQEDKLIFNIPSSANNLTQNDLDGLSQLITSRGYDISSDSVMKVYFLDVVIRYWIYRDEHFVRPIEI